MHQKSHAGYDCSGDTVFKPLGGRAASAHEKENDLFPQVSPISLPPAFSHRHVFKTLKFPIWDF